ncbi:hypothetical protein DCAR_0728807 [Daucus carota subsp. sativus]|uniref:Uncharacterized protein n=1 Tax=Daucus carota subsp. sativus TaxID=79200 RepID=A0A164TUW8_DAUCS|nr:hypothetical protein DCAR_0728807 [Daucus carota subsp. sativus]
MAMLCSCGMVAVQRTSWTDNNYARRFLGCVYGAKGCNYFRWVDPPSCPNCCHVIPGLLRKIEVCEEKVIKLEHDKKKLKKWCLIVFVCVVSMAVSRLVS